MRRPVEIGYELWQQGRRAEALRMFERAVSEEPNEPRVHLFLAIALAQQGDTARAEKHFAQAIALGPRDGFVFYNWGVYLHQQGRLQEALRAYQTAYMLDPTLVAALNAIRSLQGGAGGQGTLQPSGAGQVGGMSSPVPVSIGTPIPPLPNAGTQSGFATVGYVFAFLGLCIPFVGLIGGITFGVLALKQGDKRGVGVIFLSILLAIPGLICIGLMSTVVE